MPSDTGEQHRAGRARQTDMGQRMGREGGTTGDGEVSHDTGG